MRRIYLVLLPALTVLNFSCHKDHNNPAGTPTGPASSVPPALTTVTVTDITDSTATSGGVFTTDGTAVINSKGIQWDTSSQFPNKWTASAGTGIGNFTVNFSGLFPNTLYYARAFAGTDSTTHVWYGNTVQFTTNYTLGKYLVSTLAGTGSSGNANGNSQSATFSGPAGVAVDNAGNIFVADGQNKAIRKITPSGTVSTLAATDAIPSDVVTDSAGNVYVAESSFKILKISPTGQVSTLAGSGQEGHRDGTGTSAVFDAAVTLAIDPAGNLYVGDVFSYRKITPAGVVSTLTNYFSAANSSWVIGVDNHFNLYESNKYTAIKVDSSGNESFLAGSGQSGNANGTGSAASFGNIDELRVDTAGNIYVADVVDNKVRMITQAGVVSTVAGTGVAGDADGNSAIATFNAPSGLAIDNSGNIIVADISNNKIRKITLH